MAAGGDAMARVGYLAGTPISPITRRDALAEPAVEDGSKEGA